MPYASINFNALFELLEEINWNYLFNQKSASEVFKLFSDRLENRIFRAKIGLSIKLKFVPLKPWINYELSKRISNFVSLCRNPVSGNEVVNIMNKLPNKKFKNLRVLIV